jgi:ketopantoate reductase
MQIVCNGKVLDWVKDYISNRQQVVFINNETSNYSDIKAGVPQGSKIDKPYACPFIY